MVDLEYLGRLLLLLERSNVSTLKMAGLELCLNIPASTLDRSLSPPTSQVTEETANPAPDLRADDTMNFDKILNWSTGADPSELDMPLTGEEPL